MNLFVVHSWRTWLITNCIISSSIENNIIICSRNFFKIICECGLDNKYKLDLIDIDPVHQYMYEVKSPHINTKILEFVELNIKPLIKNKSVHLFIPHFLDPWNRFLASLPEVKKVDFIEEGIKIAASQESIYSINSNLIRSYKYGEFINQLQEKSFDEQAYVTSDSSINSKLKTAMLYCTGDLYRFQGFPKYQFEDKFLKSISVNTINYINSFNSNIIPDFQSKCIFFLGSKHHMDINSLKEEIQQIRSNLSDTSQMYYKPHPSCLNLYNIQSITIDLNLILVESKVPVDLLVLSSLFEDIYWVGHSTSLLVSIKRMGLNFLQAGDLRRNKNFDRCASAMELFRGSTALS